VSTKKPVLLIAEDDELERSRWVELASDLGFSVLEAPDGVQALARFQSTQVDLVVTDFYMPGMDGLAFVKGLRADPRGARVPIMVITSDDLRRTKIRLLQAGADDFLVKPVEHLEFTARLGAMARRARLLDVLDRALSERDRVRQRARRRDAHAGDLVVALSAAMERSGDHLQTRNHLRRVSALAAMLAEAHACDAELVDQVRRYAVLHDVGMVGISDSILFKRSGLEATEYEEVKTHTLIGGELLQEAGLPAVACNIATHHHERWDGTGYPHRLAGPAIPIEARLVAVVDVFDAILAARHGQQDRSLSEAWTQLEAAGGKQLDLAMVKHFLGLREQVERVVRTFPAGAGQAEAWE